MTAGELQDLLVTALVRKAGGSKRDWRAALGPIRVYSAGDASALQLVGRAVGQQRRECDHRAPARRFPREAIRW
jgi:hypothetical protein